MNSGSVTAQARSFRDLKEICRRADIVMLDHQRRDDDTGFQQNGDTGKRVHELRGLEQARARVDGDVRVGSRLLPRREQAGGGSAHVDDCGNRRRHPAVVALRRRVPRGPADVPHAGAGDALVARERRLSGRSHAGRDRRPRVVAAQHGLLRARRSGPARRRALHRLHARARQGARFRTFRSTSTTSSGSRAG